MKKLFITGLVILLPLALTIAIAMFVFNLLTVPFAGIVQSVLNHYDLLDHGFLFLSSAQLQQLVSQILILLFLFFFTVSLGIIARWFFFHYLLRLWDSVLHRIPFISTVYKTCQDVISTIFTSSTKSFKQAVLVPFPNADTLSVGLITREKIEGLESENLVSVFVPTTPNPTSGFLMLFKEKDLIYLNITVEEAFKYIVSCGIISTPFHVISSEEARLDIKP